MRHLLWFGQTPERVPSGQVLSASCLPSVSNSSILPMTQPPPW